MYVLPFPIKIHTQIFNLIAAAAAKMSAMATFVLLKDNATSHIKQTLLVKLNLLLVSLT